jgi:hypothetical protein
LFLNTIDSDRISLLDANRVKDEKGNYIFNSDNKSYQLVENPVNQPGLVKMNFKSTDKFSYIDNVTPDDPWTKFWFGTKPESIEFSPITIIDSNHTSLTTDHFAEEYLVNTQDVSAIKKELQEANDNDELVVLLRFAVTDYTVKNARFDYVEEDKDDVSEQNGYVAQETAFLDFDVISLSFSDSEGVVREVIAIVADPIDIIHGLTPPDTLVEDQEWWLKLVGLMLVMILLFVGYILLDIYVPWLAKIIRWVVGAFWWLFTSLLKLITWPFRALLSSAGRSIKRKLKIKSPRGRKRRRGRPSKKKETRNRRLMRETFGKLKDKAYATLENIKNKNKKE